MGGGVHFHSRSVHSSGVCCRYFCMHLDQATAIDIKRLWNRRFDSKYKQKTRTVGAVSQTCASLWTVVGFTAIGRSVGIMACQQGGSWFSCEVSYRCTSEFLVQYSLQEKDFRFRSDFSMRFLIWMSHPVSRRASLLCYSLWRPGTSSRSPLEELSITSWRHDICSEKLATTIPVEIQ